MARKRVKQEQEQQRRKKREKKILEINKNPIVKR